MITVQKIIIIEVFKKRVKYNVFKNFRTNWLICIMCLIRTIMLSVKIKN